MTSLKIAQVATSDASVQLLLLDHIQALTAAGHQVTAVCAPGRWTDDLRRSGIDVENVAMNREATPLADALAVGGLTKLFRKKKFDVVHAELSQALHDPLLVFQTEAIFLLYMKQRRLLAVPQRCVDDILK